MLLIFIMGPGGSHLLEGGWQARLRTLRTPRGCALLLPSKTTPGPGTQRPMDVESRVGTEE